MVDQRNSEFDLLLPVFRSRLMAGLATARGAGLDVYLFEGWRSPTRQLQLYNEGRTAPGGVVTDAPAWQSWHQYGCAADIVFGGPGKWSWGGDYHKLAPILKAEGLEWAGDWKNFKELPHFQLTGGLSISAAMTLNKQGGILCVWDAILKSTGLQPAVS